VSTPRDIPGILDILLEARDVRFSYTRARPVICGASLALRRGEMGAIIGPNGCGKSTLMRLLAGLVVPSGGEVQYEGTPIASIARRKLAKKIAYVPQSMGRAFPFTALEIVLTGRSPYVPRFRFESHQDVERAWEALEAVDAAHLGQRPVTELSDGERQLVSVARALAQEPDCLLLDEPSASLDLKHRAGLLRTLVALRSRTGLMVLMVTHDLSLLDPGFDVIFAMRGGAVAAQGTPDGILRQSVLEGIYDDPHIRTHRVDGGTVVWSEV